MDLGYTIGKIKNEVLILLQKLKDRKAQRKQKEKDYFEKLQSRLQKELNDYTDDLKNVTNEKTKELLEREINEARDFLDSVNSTLENMDK